MRLIALFCLSGFASTFSMGAFPALLPPAAPSPSATPPSSSS